MDIKSIKDKIMQGQQDISLKELLFLVSEVGRLNGELIISEQTGEKVGKTAELWHEKNTALRAENDKLVEFRDKILDTLGMVENRNSDCAVARVVELRKVWDEVNGR